MEIGKLVQSLGLGELQKEPSEVKGGLLHKMYRVTTSKGEYAVKVLNSEIMKRPTALLNTVNSEKIAAAFTGILPVVAAMEVQGKQIHELDGSFYMVFPWVEGRSVFPREINEKHCAAMGDILGRMHRADIAVDGVDPEVAEAEEYPWDTYLQSAREQEKQNIQEEQNSNWLSQYEKAVCDIKKWNRAACDAQQTLAQTLVLSHRDLDPKNVMWNGAEPLIIDWEAAGYINPYQEFLEVLNYWADDGNGGLVHSYFDALTAAYGTYMSLVKVPWDAVFAGSFSGMLGWLDYNLRRAMGIEASGEEEIRMGEEQVIGTIGALYAYCDKVKQMQEWLGIKNDR